MKQKHPGAFMFAQRVLCLLLSVVAMAGILPAIAYALTDNSQHKTNIFSLSSELFSVYFIKKEKNSEGQTDTPVPGAEFELFKEGENGTHTKIGGYYITGTNGEICVSRLTRGKYYFVETQPPFGYTYDEKDGAPVTRYDFEITPENTPQDFITLTAFNRRLSSGLSITKQIQNPDESPPTAEQREASFSFTVTFGNGQSYSYKKGEDTFSLESGGTLSLRHGETAIFENLPLGLYYAITETPAEGYIIKSENSSGNIGAEGASALFVNIPDVPLGPSGSLSIQKEVTGEGADLAKPFEFHLSLEGGYTCRYRIDGGEPQTFTGGAFTLLHGQTAHFENLPAGLGYSITESDYTAEGYIATHTEYSGHVLHGGALLSFSNLFVQGEEAGSLAIEKHLAGEGADPEKDFLFTVTFSAGETFPLSINGGETFDLANGGTLTLKGGQSALISGIPAGVSYTVTEEDYTADSYIAGVQTATGTIASGSPSTVIFKNEKTPPGPPGDTALTIIKRVEGTPPAQDAAKEFPFVLTINGEDTSFTLKPDEEKTFTLPPGAVYQVREEDIQADGYSQIAISNGAGTAAGQAITVTQTNAYTGPGLVPVTVQKIWQAPPDYPQPSEIQVQLYKDGQPHLTPVTLSDENNWIHTWENLNRANVWTVNEVDVPSGYRHEISGNIEEGFTILNYAYKEIVDPQEQVNIAVQKVWQHGSNPAENQPQSITLLLKNGSQTVAQKEVTSAENWEWTFTVPAFDESGQLINYTVDEAEVPGYNKAISGFTITNTFDENGQIPVTVQKIWQAPEGYPQPSAIQVQLYKDGQPHLAPVTLSDENNWAYTWENLDTSSVWTVDEVQVPTGYRHEVSGNIEEGFTIRNYAYKEIVDPQEQVNIAVQKVWQHGGNPAENQPQSITLLLKNGSQTVAQKVLTAEDNWEWTFTAPAFDENNRVIHYTIDELDVPGYQKSISGFVVTNTFTGSSSSSGAASSSGGQGTPPPSTGTTAPKTSDNSTPLLWLTLMLVCSFTLKLLLFPPAKLLTLFKRR